MVTSLWLYGDPRQVTSLQINYLVKLVSESVGCNTKRDDTEFAGRGIHSCMQLEVSKGYEETTSEFFFSHTFSCDSSVPEPDCTSQLTPHAVAVGKVSPKYIHHSRQPQVREEVVTNMWRLSHLPAYRPGDTHARMHTITPHVAG